MKQYANLLNGKAATDGDAFEVVSPLDQKVIGQGFQISHDQLDEVFKKSLPLTAPTASIEGTDKLAKYLQEHRKEFIDQIILETGYIKKDSEDIVDGSIELVTHFNEYLHDTEVVIPKSKFSYAHEFSRKLQITAVPYGIVAAMTPQNAPLILELTVLLNALAAGNTVILRPSSQCVGTAALLGEALVASLPESVLNRITIVLCKATDFLDLSYKMAHLIHYIGSSLHGTKILRESLDNNVKAMVDGEGSSTVIIDESAPLEEAVDACFSGIIRSNGELCSSLRLIAVEETKYEEFKKRLVDKLNNIKIGDPRSKDSDMGPLFHEKQAENLKYVAQKYFLISGDLQEKGLGKNYMTPLLLELKRDEKSFLQEEVYGPIVGIVSYNNDEWKKWLTEAPYHLNNAVFSNNKSFINEFIATSKAPRIIINHDPSIESTFEPWGAFLPSGQNDVSFWYNKYIKNIQIDSPDDF